MLKDELRNLSRFKELVLFIFHSVAVHARRARTAEKDYLRLRAASEAGIFPSKFAEKFRRIRTATKL